MENLEIERKLVIKKPDFDRIRKMEGYTESKIEQIYIRTENKFTSHRIRRREYSTGVIEYTETFKRRVDRMSAEEREKVIDRAEYERLSLMIESGTHPVIKTRRTFDYLGRAFELDEYPEWSDSCIMEVELPSVTERVTFPDFIEIIREVTGDGSYSNHSMSHLFPKELC